MHKETPMATSTGGSANSGRRRRAARWLRVAAIACLVLAGWAFALHAAAWLAFPRVSPAMLPPAGETIEGKAPFRFAYVADSRGNLDTLEAVLERIKADRVKLVLTGGDLVERPDTCDYEWLLHELEEAQLGVPFCAAPGNHDADQRQPDQAARYRLYCRSFGPRRYWFACANAMFVALDTSSEACPPDDLRWLDRTLARYRDQYEACIVFTHVPPFDPRGRRYCLRSGAEEVKRILNAHRVTALFASHIHSYLEARFGDVPLYISGGAGAQLDEPIFPHHYLLCTVEPGGALRVERKSVTPNTWEDYWEHKLLVKWPRMMGVLPPLALVFAGVLLLGVSSTRRRRRPPSGESPERS